MPTTISSSILDSLAVGWGKKNLHMFWRVSQVVLSPFPHPIGGTTIQEDCYKPSSNWEEGVASTTACNSSYTTTPADLHICVSADHCIMEKAQTSLV